MTNNIPKERNLEHERAKYAFNCVLDIENRGESNEQIKGKYKTLVMNSAYLIQKSGLLQSLTFYCSKMTDKGEKEHFKKLNLHILKWLLMEDDVRNNPNTQWNENKDDTLTLFKIILDKDNDEILNLTQKTKALLIWIKRFADAKFVTKKGEK